MWLAPLRWSRAPWLLVFACAALAGCPRSKDSGEAGPSATAAPPPTVTVPAAPAIAVGTYAMTKEAQNDPFLILERVVVDERSTKLDFTFTNHGKSSLQLTISPPGDKSALFLEWAPGKKAGLQRASGIGMAPARNDVAAGQTVRFSLVFDALEPGVRAFDMYEGEEAKRAMPGEQTYWVVRAIELK